MKTWRRKRTGWCDCLMAARSFEVRSMKYEVGSEQPLKVKYSRCWLQGEIQVERPVENDNSKGNSLTRYYNRLLIGEK